MLHVSVRFDDTLLTQLKRCGIWWLHKGSILHNHFIVIAPLSGSIVMIFYAWLLRSTGLRDDLQFLLEEDLSHINLCSLHCEMRNCEQLLGSLGLFVHRVGSLDELNQALSEHGPESCRLRLSTCYSETETWTADSNIEEKHKSGIFFWFDNFYFDCWLACIRTEVMTVPTFSVHVPKSHRGTIEGPYFVHKCVPQLLLHNIEQDLLSSKPLFNSVCL